MEAIHGVNCALVSDPMICWGRYGTSVVVVLFTSGRLLIDPQCILSQVASSFSLPLEPLGISNVSVIQCFEFNINVLIIDHDCS